MTPRPAASSNWRAVAPRNNGHLPCTVTAPAKNSSDTTQAWSRSSLGARWRRESLKAVATVDQASTAASAQSVARRWSFTIRHS